MGNFTSLVGGHYEAENAEATDLVERYDPVNNTWETKAPFQFLGWVL